MEENKNEITKRRLANNPGTVVASTIVGRHLCGDRPYWLQRRKYSTGGLCTYYSFEQFSGVALNWTPSWNCDASKVYAPGSQEHQCFEQDNPC